MAEPREGERGPPGSSAAPDGGGWTLALEARNTGEEDRVFGYVGCAAAATATEDEDGWLRVVVPAGTTGWATFAVSAPTECRPTNESPDQAARVEFQYLGESSEDVHVSFRRVVLRRGTHAPTPGCGDERGARGGQTGGGVVQDAGRDAKHTVANLCHSASGSDYWVGKIQRGKQAHPQFHRTLSEV